MTSLPSPNHTIWLRPHNAAFVYLPKVACTSWKLHLAAALNIQTKEELSYKNLHNPSALPLPYAAHLTPKESDLFKSKQSEGSFKYFSVLREPKERAASAYLDKILFHKNPQSFFSLEIIPAIKSHARIATDDKPSFEQFLLWILESEHQHVSNDHWKPMCDILQLKPEEDNLKQWTLWPMQEMAKAVSTINQYLGVDLTLPGREALGPRPDRKSKSALNELLNLSSEGLLQEIYSADIALFKLIKS
ncbi:Sulfotransferase family protein [Prochlorococcus sp. MIT 1303]|nr:Sulfotransferase family protein [Prochlorococcus sp. MIT 1303]